MIKQITFSPTGGTKKVADAIASGISENTEIIELCCPASKLSAVSLGEDDFALAIKKACAERKKNELFI